MKNKYYHFFLILFMLMSNVLFAQIKSSSDIKGLFLSVGVGPRFPIGDLGNQQAIGAGFDVTISYSNTDVFPLFYYGQIGYQNHPGDIDYYKVTDHSSLSTNIISFHGGLRYFFTPILKEVVLLMPFLNGGISYAYITKFHQYKIDTNRRDNLEDLSKLGFHIGGGLSFFLMDILVTYNYLNANQYFSFDLRLTIPLAATL